MQDCNLRTQRPTAGATADRQSSPDQGRGPNTDIDSASTDCLVPNNDTCMLSSVPGGHICSSFFWPSVITDTVVFCGRTN